MRRRLRVDFVSLSLYTILSIRGDAPGYFLAGFTSQRSLSPSLSVSLSVSAAQRSLVSMLTLGKVGSASCVSWWADRNVGCWLAGEPFFFSSADFFLTA